mmetsp:Transcript_110227/g.212396  ORF Transcript_110227/g.212396 Transcript_110227/m.212396 type:complete len:121 (-) Transcript_110227:919-1281(-)
MKSITRSTNGDWHASKWPVPLEHMGAANENATKAWDLSYQASNHQHQDNCVSEPFLVVPLPLSHHHVNRRRDLLYDCSEAKTNGSHLSCQKRRRLVSDMSECYNEDTDLQDELKGALAEC